MNKPRLSWPMKRLLVCLAKGGQARDLCHSQSDYGGMHGTVFALQRRGLLNWKTGGLTAEGRKLAAELVEAQKPKPRKQT